MIGRVVTFVGISSVIGCYATARNNPISLNNQYLGSLFKFVNFYVHIHPIKTPSYSMTLFKMLLKMKVLRKQQKLAKYILSSGFDAEGKYLNEICEIGFKGMEVGPISFLATQPEQQYLHLGVKASLANINTFSQYNPQSQFQVSLNIVPNQQILKITPYLLKQNLIQSLQTYQNIQKHVDRPLVQKINVDYNHPMVKLSGRSQPQVIKMIKQIQKNSKDLINQTNQAKQITISIQFQSKRQEHLSWSQLLSFITNQTQI